MPAFACISPSELRKNCSYGDATGPPLGVISFGIGSLDRATRAFADLGCRFERARCLELAGDVVAAREEYERLGAIPALERAGV